MYPVKTSRSLRACLGQETGVALIEFAMVFPVLLLFLLAATDLTRYVLLSQKLDKANASVADVVAQAQSIQTSDLSTLMTAVTNLLAPYPFTANGRILVSDVSNNGTNTRVRWQYCGGNYSAASKVGAVNATATLPTGFTLASGEDIIVVETLYNFSPVLGNQLLANSVLYKVAYFKPRFGALSAYVSSCSG